MTPSTPPATTETPVWRRWLVLVVMSVGTLIVFIDNTVVNTALPAISIDLGASISTLQWIVDAYVLALVGLLLLGGSLGDRYGRRLWMVIGLLVFGAASVVAALSTSSEQLIIGRALQGVGAALVLPATLSIITNTFPRGDRTKAIAIWTRRGRARHRPGPGHRRLHRRRTRLGRGLLDAPAGHRHRPGGHALRARVRDERQLGLDIPGAILGTAGVTALIFGIIQGNELGWTSVEIIRASSPRPSSSSAPSPGVELRSEHPMLPLRFFRQKDFSGAVLAIGLIVFAMLVVFFYLTQFFQIVQGRTAPRGRSAHRSRPRWR